MPAELIWRINGVTVDPSANRLRARSRTIHVEPRAMQVLVTLLRHSGEVVTRRNIFSSVWGRGEATDDTLNRLIFDLRSAFKELANGDPPIETIRGVGYRVTAARKVVKTGPMPGLKRLSVAVVVLAATAVTLTQVSLTQKDHGDPPMTVRVIANDIGIETSPAFDAVNDRLLFACGDPDQGGRSICARDRPGSMTGSAGSNRAGTSLSRAIGDGLAIHPDGDLVAYQRIEPDRCEIRTVSIRTGSDRLISECRRRNDGSLAWEPKGQRLYYSDALNDDPDSPLHVISIGRNGADAIVVTRPPAHSVGDLYPTVSGGGQHLAFFRADRAATTSTYITPGIGRIFVASLDSPGPPRPLTTEPAEITGMAWRSEDLVFFSNGGDHRFRLWLSSAGAPPLPFGQLAGIPRKPAMAGENIVAELWQSEADIMRQSLADTNLPPATVFSSTRFDFAPAIAADGTSIAFVSWRSDRPQLWLGDLTTGEASPIDLGPGTDVESPRWSADSQQLVFETRVNGISALAIYDRSAAATGTFGAMISVTRKQPG